MNKVGLKNRFALYNFDNEYITTVIPTKDGKFKILSRSLGRGLTFYPSAEVDGKGLRDYKSKYGLKEEMHGKIGQSISGLNYKKMYEDQIKKWEDLQMKLQTCVNESYENHKDDSVQIFDYVLELMKEIEEDGE